MSLNKSYNFSKPKRETKRLSLHMLIDTPEKVALAEFLDALSKNKMVNSWATSALLTQFQDLSKARLDDPAVISTLANDAILEIKGPNERRKSPSISDEINASLTPAKNQNQVIDEPNLTENIHKQSCPSVPIDNTLNHHEDTKEQAKEQTDFSKYQNAFSVSE